MSMLGNLVHMRDEIVDDGPFYVAPKGEGWLSRAWRTLFGRKHEKPAH